VVIVSIGSDCIQPNNSAVVASINLKCFHSCGCE